jgi:hypothetical protein
MDSDENDDRLSWQAVSARSKKITRLTTTKVPTMKKNKLQETNDHPPQITITNKFEALRHAETEASTTTYICHRNHKHAATNSYN